MRNTLHHWWKWCETRLRMLVFRLTLRARCKAKLREVPRPRPFSVQALCAAVAAQRGRPIILQPADPEALEPGVHGYKLPFPEADVIVFNQQTTLLNQLYTIVHELCHLIWGHRTTHQASETMALIFADLPVETVQARLSRTDYAASREEQEANTLALMVLQQIITMMPTAETTETTDPEIAALRRRLRAFFEGRKD